MDYGMMAVVISAQLNDEEEGNAELKDEEEGNAELNDVEEGDKRILCIKSTTACRVLLLICALGVSRFYLLKLCCAALMSLLLCAKYFAAAQGRSAIWRLRPTVISPLPKQMKAKCN